MEGESAGARRRLRREGDRNDWELKFAPPVNVVLPVGRAYVTAMRKALGV